MHNGLVPGLSLKAHDAATLLKLSRTRPGQCLDGRLMDGPLNFMDANEINIDDELFPSNQRWTEEYPEKIYCCC